MHRKKILFLITKATWGGAQKYVFDLAATIPKDRFESVVAYGVAGKLSKDLAAAGIETHRIPTMGRDIAFVSDISSFFQILVCLWRVRPDVVHLNSSKAAALGAFAARIMGVRKIIFTVHGWPFNEKRNELARIAIYLVSWFTAALSSTIIVVSKSDEVQGKKMSLVGNKIHYIPIGIEPPQFLPREEAWNFISEHIPLARIIEHWTRVVTIAELTPNKGLRYALEAFAELKRRGKTIMLIVVGAGEERAALEKHALELDINDRVYFTGFISDASKYLKAFDVFLLPSIKEGMPYVLLEAAEAGVPTVTTNVVNPAILENQQRMSVVPPADPDAIADNILEITVTPEGKGIFSPAQFPFSEMLKKTTALY